MLMKIREIMSHDPVCCVPGDLAQKVAGIIRDRNVGSLPVVADQESRELIGMITDRDPCCSVIADGLDPKDTTMERFISADPATCREGVNVEARERAMHEHRLRRIPILDAQGASIGTASRT